MSVHVLKTAPQPFLDVWKGMKRAEYRVNDRNFAVGDLMILKEWSGNSFTGHLIVCRISHVQEGFGIPAGYAMLSFEICCLVTPYDVTSL